jgi:2OG-Fe(II) oxygenase superfamily
MSTEPLEGTQLPELDFEWLERDIERLAGQYRAASPYPHVVLDDFLEAGLAEKAAGEFPPLDPTTWNNYLHVNERKFSNTDPTTWGPTLQAILEQLNSPRFVRIVQELMGVEDLFADPSLEGGGLHQSSTGGFLNIHADFTVHPHNRKWQRRANLILYLNEGWQPDYGGDLELWSADMKECVKKVSPISNRVLIFSTDPTSYHGHPEPMTCPEGVARRSLALYYFTLEDDPVARSTDYRARPGDGGQSILIYADKQLLRGYDWAKRRLGLSDQLASRLLAFRDRVRRKGPQGE